MFSFFCTGFYYFAGKTSQANILDELYSVCLVEIYQGVHLV